MLEDHALNYSNLQSLNSLSNPVFMKPGFLEKYKTGSVRD